MINLDLEEYSRIKHKTAMLNIASALSSSDIPYCFIKSSSLALQGLPIHPNDIDIETTAKGAYNIQRLLKPIGNLLKEVQYSTDGVFGSYFGKLNIDGIQVEIIGELTENHSGRWKSNNPVLEERVFVDENGYLIPVSRLEHERKSYHELNRKKDTLKITKLQDMFSLKI